MPLASLGLVVALLTPPDASLGERPPVQVPKSGARAKPATVEPARPSATPIVLDPSDLPSDPASDPRKTIEPSKRWKLPRDGGAALVGSGLMFAACLGLGIPAIALAPRNFFEHEGLMGAGAGVLGVGGAVALGFGLEARRQYRATPLGQAPDRPRTGRGVEAAAGISMTAGSVLLLTAQVMLFAPSDEDFSEPFAEIGMLAGGAGLLVIGSSMLVVAKVRRTKYRKWMNQRPTRVQPTLGFGRGGMQLGVVGRF